MFSVVYHRKMVENDLPHCWDVVKPLCHNAKRELIRDGAKAEKSYRIAYAEIKAQNTLCAKG